MSGLYFSLLLMFTLLSLNVVGLRSRNKIEEYGEEKFMFQTG